MLLFLLKRHGPHLVAALLGIDLSSCGTGSRCSGCDSIDDDYAGQKYGDSANRDSSASMQTRVNEKRKKKEGAVGSLKPDAGDVQEEKKEGNRGTVASSSRSKKRKSSPFQEAEEGQQGHHAQRKQEYKLRRAGGRGSGDGDSSCIDPLGDTDAEHDIDEDEEDEEEWDEGAGEEQRQQQEKKKKNKRSQQISTPQQGRGWGRGRQLTEDDNADASSRGDSMQRPYHHKHAGSGSGSRLGRRYSSTGTLAGSGSSPGSCGRGSGGRRSTKRRYSVDSSSSEQDRQDGQAEQGEWLQVDLRTLSHASVDTALVSALARSWAHSIRCLDVSSPLAPATLDSLRLCQYQQGQQGQEISAVLVAGGGGVARAGAWAGPSSGQQELLRLQLELAVVLTMLLSNLVEMLGPENGELALRDVPHLFNDFTARSNSSSWHAQLKVTQALARLTTASATDVGGAYGSTRGGSGGDAGNKGGAVIG